MAVWTPSDENKRNNQLVPQQQSLQASRDERTRGLFSRMFGRNRDNTESQIDPNKTRKLGIGGQAAAGVNQLGEAIYNLSGFDEEDYSALMSVIPGLNKTVDRERAKFNEVMPAAWDFLKSIPLGMASAPFTGGAKLYQAISGDDILNADHGYTYDQDLTGGERVASAADGLVDIAGLALGASGRVIGAIDRTLMPAAEVAENVAHATSTGRKIDKVKDIHQKLQAINEGPAQSTAGKFAWDIAEEGAEEISQQQFQNIYEHNGTWFGDDSVWSPDSDTWGEALGAGFLGAVGGGIGSGTVQGLQYLSNRLNPKNNSNTTNEVMDVPQMTDAPSTALDKSTDYIPAVAGVDYEEKNAPGVSPALIIHPSSRVKVNQTESSTGFYRGQILAGNESQRRKVASNFGLTDDQDVQSFVALFMPDENNARAAHDALCRRYGIDPSATTGQLLTQLAHSANSRNDNLGRMFLWKEPATNHGNVISVKIGTIIDSDAQSVAYHPALGKMFNADLDGDKMKVGQQVENLQAYSPMQVFTDYVGNYATRKDKKKKDANGEPLDTRTPAAAYDPDFSTLDKSEGAQTRGDAILDRYFQGRIPDGDLDKLKTLFHEALADTKENEADLAFYQSLIANTNNAYEADGQLVIEDNFADILDELENHFDSPAQMLTDELRRDLSFLTEETVMAAASDVNCEIVKVNEHGQEVNIGEGVNLINVLLNFGLYPDIEGHGKTMFRFGQGSILMVKKETFNEQNGGYYRISDPYELLFTATAHLAHMASVPVDNISGLFKNIVLSACIETGQLRSNGFTNQGSLENFVRDVFVKSWNDNVDTYNQALHDASIQSDDYLDYKMQEKPKLEIGENGEISDEIWSEFFRVFGGMRADLFFPLETGEFEGMTLQEWVEFQSARRWTIPNSLGTGRDQAYREYINYLMSRMQKVFGSTYSRVNNSIDKRVDEIITSIRGITNNGKEPAKITSFNYGAWTECLTQIAQLVGVKESRRIGFGDRNRVMDLEVTQRIVAAAISGNKEAIKNEIFGLRLEGVYADVIHEVRLMNEARNADPQCNVDNYIRRIQQHAARVYGTSDFHRMILDNFIRELEGWNPREEQFFQLDRTKLFKYIDHNITFSEKERAYEDAFAGNTVQQPLLASAVVLNDSAIELAGYNDALLKAEAASSACMRLTSEYWRADIHKTRDLFTRRHVSDSAQLNVLKKIAFRKPFKGNVENLADMMWSTFFGLDANVAEKSKSMPASTSFFQQVQILNGQNLAPYTSSITGGAFNHMTGGSFASNKLCIMDVLFNPDAVYHITIPGKEGDVTLTQQTLFQALLPGETIPADGVTMDMMWRAFDVWPEILTYICPSQIGVTEGSAGIGATLQQSTSLFQAVSNELEQDTDEYSSIRDEVEISLLQSPPMLYKFTCTLNGGEYTTVDDERRIDNMTRPGQFARRIEQKWNEFVDYETRMAIAYASDNDVYVENTLLHDKQSSLSGFRKLFEQYVFSQTYNQMPRAIREKTEGNNSSSNKAHFLTASLSYFAEQTALSEFSESEQGKELAETIAYAEFGLADFANASFADKRQAFVDYIFDSNNRDKNQAAQETYEFLRNFFKGKKKGFNKQSVIQYCDQSHYTILFNSYLRKESGNILSRASGADFSDITDRANRATNSSLGPAAALLKDMTVASVRGLQALVGKEKDSVDEILAEIKDSPWLQTLFAYCYALKELGPSFDENGGSINSMIQEIRGDANEMVRGTAANIKAYLVKNGVSEDEANKLVVSISEIDLSDQISILPGVQGGDEAIISGSNRYSPIDLVQQVLLIVSNTLDDDNTLRQNLDKMFNPLLGSNNRIRGRLGQACPQTVKDDLRSLCLTYGIDISSDTFDSVSEYLDDLWIKGKDADIRKLNKTITDQVIGQALAHPMRDVGVRVNTQARLASDNIVESEREFLKAFANDQLSPSVTKSQQKSMKERVAMLDNAQEKTAIHPNSYLAYSTVDPVLVAAANRMQFEAFASYVVPMVGMEGTTQPQSYVFGLLREHGHCDTPPENTGLTLESLNQASARQQIGHTVVLPREVIQYIPFLQHVITDEDPDGTGNNIALTLTTNIISRIQQANVPNKDSIPVLWYNPSLCSGSPCTHCDIQAYDGTGVRKNSSHDSARDFSAFPDMLRMLIHHNMEARLLKAKKKFDPGASSLLHNAPSFSTINPDIPINMELYKANGTTPLSLVAIRDGFLKYRNGVKKYYQDLFEDIKTTEIEYASELEPLAWGEAQASTFANITTRAIRITYADGQYRTIDISTFLNMNPNDNDAFLRLIGGGDREIASIEAVTTSVDELSNKISVHVLRGISGIDSEDRTAEVLHSLAMESISDWTSYSSIDAEGNLYDTTERANVLDVIKQVAPVQKYHPTQKPLDTESSRLQKLLQGQEGEKPLQLTLGIAQEFENSQSSYIADEDKWLSIRAFVDNVTNIVWGTTSAINNTAVNLDTSNEHWDISTVDLNGSRLSQASNRETFEKLSPKSESYTRQPSRTSAYLYLGDKVTDRELSSLIHRAAQRGQNFIIPINRFFDGSDPQEARRSVAGMQEIFPLGPTDGMSYINIDTINDPTDAGRRVQVLSIDLALYTDDHKYHPSGLPVGVYKREPVAYNVAMVSSDANNTSSVQSVAFCSENDIYANDHSAPFTLAVSPLFGNSTKREQDYDPVRSRADIQELLDDNGRVSREKVKQMLELDYWNQQLDNKLSKDSMVENVIAYLNLIVADDTIERRTFAKAKIPCIGLVKRTSYDFRDAGQAVKFAPIFLSSDEYGKNPTAGLPVINKMEGSVRIEVASHDAFAVGDIIKTIPGKSPEKMETLIVDDSKMYVMYGKPSRGERSNLTDRLFDSKTHEGRLDGREAEDLSQSLHYLSLDWGYSVWEEVKDGTLVARSDVNWNAILEELRKINPTKATLGTNNNNRLAKMLRDGDRDAYYAVLNAGGPFLVRGTGRDGKLITSQNNVLCALIRQCLNNGVNPSLVFAQLTVGTDGQVTNTSQDFSYNILFSQFSVSELLMIYNAFDRKFCPPDIFSDTTFLDQDGNEQQTILDKDGRLLIRDPRGSDQLMRVSAIIAPVRMIHPNVGALISGVGKVSDQTFGESVLQHGLRDQDVKRFVKLLADTSQREDYVRDYYIDQRFESPMHNEPLTSDIIDYDGRSLLGLMNTPARRAAKKMREALNNLYKTPIIIESQNEGEDVEISEQEKNLIVKAMNDVCGYDENANFRFYWEDVVRLYARAIGWSPDPSGQVNRQTKSSLEAWINGVFAARMQEGQYPFPAGDPGSRTSTCIIESDLARLLWNSPRFQQAHQELQTVQDREAYFRQQMHDAALEQRRNLQAITDPKQQAKKIAVNRLINALLLENGYVEDATSEIIYGDMTMLDVMSYEDNINGILNQDDPTVKERWQKELVRVNQSMQILAKAAEAHKVNTHQLSKNTVVSSDTHTPSRFESTVRDMSLLGKMMSLLNPLITAGSFLDRFVKNLGNRSWLALAAKGVHVLDFNDPSIDVPWDAINAVKGSATLKRIWRLIMKARIRGEDLQQLFQANSETELNDLLDQIEKQQGRIEGWFDKVAYFASGGDFMIESQIANFFAYFYVKSNQAGHDWWRMNADGVTDANGRPLSIFEAKLARPEKFMFEILSAGLQDQTGATNASLIVANQSLNCAMRSDMAQKNILALTYQKLVEDHPVAELMMTSTLCRFVQYKTNQVGNMLGWIAPMSSLHHLATRYVMSLGVDENGRPRKQWVSKLSDKNQAKLAGLAVEAEMILDTATLREALMMDAMRMTMSGLACVLIGCAGFEPPEDDEGNIDLQRIGNIEEWTLFGHRVASNWWIEDTLGLALPLAAASKAAALGHPKVGLITRGIAKSCYNNPAIAIGEAVRAVFEDDYEMDDYTLACQMAANARDGEPGKAEWLMQSWQAMGLSWLAQFVTPSVLKEIYTTIGQPEEYSYKRVVATDPQGNVRYDESGNVMYEYTTYADMALRKASKKNPVIALFLNLIRHPEGDESGYWATQMPKTVYYDQVQMEMMQKYTLYEKDERGNYVLKPDNQVQENLLRIIEVMQDYEDMNELAETGFYLDYNTKAYVSKWIWDYIQTLKDAYYDGYDYGAFSEWALGEGYYDFGKEIAAEIQQSYWDEINYWESFYYDKLWSDPMKNRLVTYNRYNTTYLKDSEGNYYASGYIKNTLPIAPFAVAPMSDDADVADRTWAHISAMTGKPMYDENDNPVRALIPAEEEPLVTPDLAVWEEYDVNNPGAYDSGKSSGSKSSSKTSSGYPSSRRSSGGGGGGGSKGYTQAPNISAPYPNNSGMIGGARTINPDFDYLRPSFETKGSREAYKREDLQ